MKYYGKYKGKQISANSMIALKRKASMIANGYFDIIDELEVTTSNFNKPITFIRINRKCPNNTIERGKWK